MHAVLAAVHTEWDAAAPCETSHQQAPQPHRRARILYYHRRPRVAAQRACHYHWERREDAGFKDIRPCCHCCCWDDNYWLHHWTCIAESWLPNSWGRYEHFGCRRHFVRDVGRKSLLRFGIPFDYGVSLLVSDLGICVLSRNVHTSGCRTSNTGSARGLLVSSNRSSLLESMNIKC